MDLSELPSDSGGTVPKIIGHPGGQTAPELNDGPGSDFLSKHMEKRLYIAKIEPLLKDLTAKDQNIYKGKKCWGEYVGDLQACGVQPPPQNFLQVAISKINPVTESYTNDYGDSVLLPGGSDGWIGEKAAELMKMTGAKDTHDLAKMLKEHNGDGLFDKILGGAGKGMELYNKIVGAGANAILQYAKDNNNGVMADMAKNVQGMLTNPWSKIGWPQVWKNCSFQSTYSLTTRLYCYNTSNDVEFKNQIMAPMAALKLFVTPRSTDGVLYTDPYTCMFKIYGMIDMEIAYISNMSFTIGGDENDFAENGRPNVVDVTMTINNIFGVCVNTRSTPDNRPTVAKTIKQGIGSKKYKKDDSDWISGGGGGNNNNNSNSNNTNSNSNSSQNSNNQGRPQISQQQQQSAAALMKMSGSADLGG